jgi:hypothetical protein
LHGTPPPADSGEDAIVLSFEGADIREVVASLAGALGISYQIDPRVEGQVTIRTTGRIPRSELFPIFNQILRSIGVAAVKVGEIYNIMPIAEAEDARAGLARQARGDVRGRHVRHPARRGEEPRRAGDGQPAAAVHHPRRRRLPVSAREPARHHRPREQRRPACAR